MNFEEPSAALQRRVLLANTHWKSFFSKLPLRAPDLTLLPDSAPTNVRRAEVQRTLVACDHPCER